MENKTAVEFAVEKLAAFINQGNQIAIDVILQRANEMFQKQIKEAYNAGYRNAEKDLGQ